MTFKPQGIIPALVTPLNEDGEVIEQGLRDVLDYTIAGGVAGVFVLGSSGETYGLSSYQKQQIVELTVEHVNGRVPIYAGASEITTRDCVATTQMLSGIEGVSALSVLTPFFMTPTQSELVQHFRTVAASTDLPMLLYSNPGRTHVTLSVATTVELSAIPNIIGVKDSAGDMTLTSDYIRETGDDFTVLMGKDTLIFPALMMGAKGAIASTANIAPKLISQLYSAFIEGDYTRARDLQKRLTPLRNLVDCATFPVVLKQGLRYVGIDAGVCLKPATELAPEFIAPLKEAVKAVTSI